MGFAGTYSAKHSTFLKKRRFMRIRLLVLSFFLLFAASNAQILRWSPVSFTDTDSVTIIYDATQGNTGLQGYTGDIYAHTGVITNISTGPSDWKYVKTAWGTNTPETKLTRIGQDLYSLVIKPGIRSYYGVPNTEQILRLAFVFRSGVQVGGSYREGKTADNGDIFLTVFGSSLNVAFLSPSVSPVFASIGDTVKLNVVASSYASNLSVYVNDQLLTQSSTNSINYNYIVTSAGKKKIKAVATGTGGVTKADSVTVMVNPAVVSEALPNGVKDGINYINDNTVTLVLQAPQKKFVYVVGEFPASNWDVSESLYMKRTPDGSRYWITISGLQPLKEYAFQYIVDGSIKIADPYSDKLLDPWNDKWIPAATYPGLKAYPTGKTDGIVSVLQTGQQQFQWTTPSFKRPAKTDLVIYELLVRDFLSTHSFKTLKDTIGYLKRLGVNAIELMPVSEFEGNESWGYNPSFYFAPDKYYGTKDDFKRFIDACHKDSIAVIMDIVLNHSEGQSPLVKLYFDAKNNRPAANNPWYNVKSPNPTYFWGYDFNHESQATKDFVDRITSYWIKEYKIDGFRFDFTKGFTNTPGDGWNHDNARIAILKRMADKIWSVDSSAYVILEHLTANSEETILANYGMLLWGNMNKPYLEAAMGYNESGKSDLSGASYKNLGWSKPHLIAYMESHDEERMMFKNITYGNSTAGYNIKDLRVALNRAKLASAFYFTIPGPKMIWQFGELGYDISIDFPERVANKPIKWDYYKNEYRLNLYKTYQALIKLKDYPAFRSSNYQMNVNSAVKRINITDPSMNVTIIGNFYIVPQEINPGFQSAGTWYDYFTGESINVTNPQGLIALNPGEFHIYTTVKLPTPEGNILSDVETVEGQKAESYELSQNYPNPFNPSTVISYRLQSASNVTLRVYDLLGREIKTLVNGEQPAGQYQVRWNADDNKGASVASGIYFYRIDAGSFNSTRKMMLIR